MYLMNTDTPVLWFDDMDYSVLVLNNDMLPYSLRDLIQSSNNCLTPKEIAVNYDKIRHFFADRVLSLSRDNAKQILISLGESQHLTEEESYQLSLKCRALSVTDSFWVKRDNEKASFQDVNLRTNSLSDAIFQVSMKGTPVSLTHGILAADISTKGMFRKAWIRENGQLFLYKSDKTSDYINTKCELYASSILDNSNVSHVSYIESVKEGVYCCKCPCFTNDDKSFVEWAYVKEYLKRKNVDILDYVREHFATEFANMVMTDYIFANPDRHIFNYGFLVDTKTNEIIGLAPAFDYNQAFVALMMHKEKEFEELIYPLTGQIMIDTVKEWAIYSDIQLSLPESLQSRMDSIKDTRG
jgi:hypothetical protein